MGLGAASAGGHNLWFIIKVDAATASTSACCAIARASSAPPNLGHQHMYMIAEVGAYLAKACQGMNHNKQESAQQELWNQSLKIAE